MIIEKIHIDGFGIFHDLRVESIPSGLMVIHGENEAGKSTLLAFLRFMFFGFPDGRSNENSYPPIRGGRYGGAITLEASDGQPYVLERRAGRQGGTIRLTLPDGQIGGRSELARLLGFATRDLYHNIFAFSLAELQQFESLSDETIKATIYSAGMGTGKVSLPAVDRELESSQELLFKTRGTNPTINLIQKELNEVRDKLRIATGHIAEYDRLHGALDEKDALITSLQQESESTTQEYEKARRLHEVWSDWIDLCSFEAELDGLPEMNSFPSGGLASLDRIQEKLEEALANIDKQASALRSKTEELDSIIVDELVFEQREAIDQLHRGRDHYDSAVGDDPKVQVEVRKAAEALEEGLHELGPDWDKDMLMAFNTSIPERDIVRSHRDSLRNAQEDLKIREGRLDLAAKALQLASKAKQDEQKALEMLTEPAEKSAGVISDRLRMLRELAILVRQRDALAERSMHLAERTKDLEMQRPQEQLGSAGIPLPIWPALGMLFFGVGMALLLTLTSYWEAGIASLLLMIVLSAGYLILRHQLRRGASQDNANAKSDLVSVQERLDEIGVQRTETQDSCSLVESQITHKCDLIRIGGQLDEPSINNLIVGAEEERQVLYLWAEAKKALDLASVKLKDAQQDFDDAEKAADDSQQNLANLRANWNEWLLKAGLQLGVTPEGVLETITAIKECRMRATTAEDLQRRLDEVRNYVKDYCRNVAAVAERCGHAPFRASDSGIVADRLVKQLQDAEEKTRQCAELAKDITALQFETKALSTRQTKLEEELHELLVEGNATSITEFRERAEAWSRRQELEKEIRQKDSTIERIAGRGEFMVAFKTELSQMIPSETELIQERAERRLSEIRESLEDALSDRGATEQQLRTLELEDDAGELRLREQALLTELRAASRTWAILAISRAIMKEAKELYERERQPGVIKDASSFFQGITHGQYVQILPSAEQSSLQVLDENGYRKQLRELSRGTQEQLYLAVRLGLIREFSQRQESLPIVMDDILVDFDPKRAEASLETILNLASTQQVLLFTCHPETRDLVRKLVPTTPAYELAGGGLRQYI